MPDTFSQLDAIVKHLDERFPDGNDIFQRVSRLTEEAGELAKEVNHRESMGVKRQKHGDSNDQQFVSEVRDVLVTAMAIAHHYNLTKELKAIVNETYDRIK